MFTLIFDGQYVINGVVPLMLSKFVCWHFDGKYVVSGEASSG